jgi:stage III sporulation protein AE
MEGCDVRGRVLQFFFVCLVSVGLFTGIHPIKVFADTGAESTQLPFVLQSVTNSSSTSPSPTAGSSAPMNASEAPSSGIGQDAVDSARQALDKAAQEQVDKLPIQQIDQYWRDLEAKYGGYLPDLSGGSLVRAVLGNGEPSFRNITHGLFRYFFTELFDDAELLGGILILTVVAAVLESMQTAFERKNVSQVAYMVVFFVLMTLAMHSFVETMAAARHAIEMMNSFMLSTIPLTVALLAASGAFASAAFFEPVLIFSVHLISNVVYVVVFPLIFFSAILELTSTLSVRYQLTRLASLLRTVGMGLLGFCLTVFIGITTIQGVGKGIADGVVLRTLKFGVGTFVPVIGKAVSDAAETVLSASLLVKNAVGIAGLIILALIAVFPALKILAVSLIYGGSAALMQPLGETPMVACLSTLGKTLLLVFACVAAVGMMFFFAICILLATANLAVITA